MNEEQLISLGFGWKGDPLLTLFPQNLRRIGKIKLLKCFLHYRSVKLLFLSTPGECETTTFFLLSFMQSSCNYRIQKF